MALMRSLAARRLIGDAEIVFGGGGIWRWHPR
jgi:hypothetical protein